MKKIVLCADDYGQNPSISQAIIALLEKNRLSATSCMTTMPDWSEQGKKLLPFVDQVDIGLHFNLTEGNPLAADSGGFCSLGRLILWAYGRRLDLAAIERELNAQLDAFVAVMGRLPDFIDGHQHVHQLPGVRDALFKVYRQRFPEGGCYLRCVFNPRLRGFKDVIIQLVGAYTFKRMVKRQGISCNSSFAGVYSFVDAARYARLFPRFLEQIDDRGIIMCHPGLAGSDDLIAAARAQEFAYLSSDQFVIDCFQAGAVLGRLE